MGKGEGWRGWEWGRVGGGGVGGGEGRGRRGWEWGGWGMEGLGVGRVGDELMEGFPCH